MTYQILGYGYTWWHADPLPQLSPHPDLRVARTTDDELIAHLAHLDQAVILERFEQGNQVYVAYQAADPIAYGWSAATIGAIDELGFDFAIPPGNRYLWDFVTLPAWRGHGIYPRLIQAILACEAAEAQRFWISHTADNTASRHGILKAGFEQIEMLVISATGALKIMPVGSQARAQVSPMALRLGLLLTDHDHSA
jgi:GNAT superfamily N-acetyltransferase